MLVDAAIVRVSVVVVMSAAAERHTETDASRHSKTDTGGSCADAHARCSNHYRRWLIGLYNWRTHGVVHDGWRWLVVCGWRCDVSGAGLAAVGTLEYDHDRDDNADDRGAHNQADFEVRVRGTCALCIVVVLFAFTSGGQELIGIENNCIHLKDTSANAITQQTRIMRAIACSKAFSLRVLQERMVTEWNALIDARVAIITDQVHRCD